MTAVNRAVGFAILTDEEMASHLETQEREQGLPLEAWIEEANAYAFKVKGQANLGLLEITPNHLSAYWRHSRGKRREGAITSREVWGALMNYTFGKAYERRYNVKTDEYDEGEEINFAQRSGRRVGNVDITPLIPYNHRFPNFKGVQLRNYRLGITRRVMVNKDNEFSITKLREKIAEIEASLERLLTDEEENRTEANATEAKRRELIREYAPTFDTTFRTTFRAQGNDTYALEIRSLTTQQAQQLLTFLEYGYGVDDPRTYRGNHD